MADNFHGEIPSRINGSKQVHNPREFDTANSGDRGWKDEKGNFTWTLNNLLPSALDIVDNTAVPPTEVDGDIYIIDSTGASHSDWDSAAANSWVRYNSTDDLWNEIGAVQGLLCYIEDVDEYFDFNGTTWAAIAGAGGGGNTIYSANDSLTGARTVSLSGNSLTFQGATPLLSIDGTDGTSSAVLSINNSTGTGGNAGFVLQSGAVSKWLVGNNHGGGGSVDEFVIANGALDTAHKLVISQAGDVGIGTNAPARKVEIAVASGVTHALRLTRDSNTVNNGVVQTFALDDSGGTPTEYAFIAGGIITNTDGAEEGFLKFDTIRAGAIDFSAGDPTMMLRNKKVGIGIIPVSVLDVKSTGATSSTFSFRAASAGDSNLFTCRDDGKIGIGTAAPTEKLHVVGSIKMVDTNEGAGKVLTSDVNGVGSWATPAGGADGDGIYDGSGSLSGATVVTQAANTLAFTASAVNAFSVDGTTFSVDASNNRVGIGTAAPVLGLDVRELSIIQPTSSDETTGVQRGLQVMNDYSGAPVPTNIVGIYSAPVISGTLGGTLTGFQAVMTGSNTKQTGIRLDGGAGSAQNYGVDIALSGTSGSNSRGINSVLSFSNVTASCYALLGFNTSSDATQTGTIYGTHSSSTKTGGGIGNGTVVGGFFKATNGLNNYAIIVPSGGGDVGIGTAAPTSKLHVVGDVMLTTDLLMNSTKTSVFGFEMKGIATTDGHYIRNAAGNSRVVLGYDPNGSRLFMYNNSNVASFGYISDKVGLGFDVSNPANILAKLHVEQDSATGAMPVLTLDQVDVSEEMIQFESTVGTGNAIEAVGAKTLTTTHFIKVTLTGGLTRYIPVGTIA